MRILHAIAGAEFGGAETIAQDQIAALAAAGVEQCVVTRPYPGALQRFAAAKVPVVPFQYSRVDGVLGRGGRVLRREAQRFGADLVQTWMSRAASFVPADLPCPAAGWFGGYYDLKYYRRCDFAIGLTADIVAHIVKAGMPAERVFLVHSFGTLPEAPALDRASLTTPADAPLVLVMSRLHDKKGIDTILKALVDCPGIYLWLAGEGPERQRLEALCRRLGLDDRVRFLGWRTDRTALYRAADMVALPSRYEPFGTVITEAWAIGRPLIASRAAGAAAHVSDGQDGMLVPIDDAAALAQAISRLARDPALRARLAAGGDASYRRDFTQDAVVARLREVYAEMLRLGKR